MYVYMVCSMRGGKSGSNWKIASKYIIIINIWMQKTTTTAKKNRNKIVQPSMFYFYLIISIILYDDVRVVVRCGDEEGEAYARFPVLIRDDADL